MVADIGSLKSELLRQRALDAHIPGLHIGFVVIERDHKVGTVYRRVLDDAVRRDRDDRRLRKAGGQGAGRAIGVQRIVGPVLPGG